MLHDIRIAGFGEGFLHELVAGHDFVNIHFSGWLVLGDDGSGSFLLLCGPDIVFLAGMPERGADFSFRQADRAALHIKDGHFVDVVRVIDYHDALTHVREKCIMIIVVVFDGDTAFVDHPLLGIAAQKTKGIMVADNPLYGQIFGINLVGAFAFHVRAAVWGSIILCYIVGQQPYEFIQRGGKGQNLLVWDLHFFRPDFGVAARVGLEAAAKAVLEQVGLGHRIDHRPSQLSGGEQQRVCIARALVNQPPVIFADEPTGNLDEKNEALVLDLLQELNHQGRTIVMVTHNPELGDLTDRVIYLYHGKFVKEEIHEK